MSDEWNEWSLITHFTHEWNEWRKIEMSELSEMSEMSDDWNYEWRMSEMSELSGEWVKWVNWVKWVMSDEWNISFSLMISLITHLSISLTNCPCLLKNVYTRYIEPLFLLVGPQRYKDFPKFPSFHGAPLEWNFENWILGTDVHFYE